MLLGDANPNTLIALDGVNNAIAGFEGNDNIYGEVEMILSLATRVMILFALEGE